MYELAGWIDRNYNIIKHTELFVRYFADTDLEQIEDDDTFYVENSDKGIDVVFSENLDVIAVHLFSGKFLNLNIFNEELPFDLNFLFSRVKVSRLLGEANVRGGGYGRGQLGIVPYWDKYYFDSYSLHLQYSNDESYIELITIGTLKFEENIIAE